MILFSVTLVYLSPFVFPFFIFCLCVKYVYPYISYFLFYFDSLLSRVLCMCPYFPVS